MRERTPSQSFRRFDDVQDLNGDSAVSDPLLALHEVERAVWSELHSLPGVYFSSLIVRRTRDGVCIQGVMETDDGMSPCDVENLVREVAGIEKVVNRLLIRESARPALPR